MSRRPAADVVAAFMARQELPDPGDLVTFRVRVQPTLRLADPARRLDGEWAGVITWRRGDMFGLAEAPGGAGTVSPDAGLCRRGFPAALAAGHRSWQMRTPVRPGRVRQAGTQTRHHSRRRLAAARSATPARPPGRPIRPISPVHRPVSPGRRLTLAAAGGPLPAVRSSAQLARPEMCPGLAGGRACAVPAGGPALTVPLLDGHAMPRPG